MKRIIIHWTGGTSVPNSHEKECYHYLVDGLGRIYNGKFEPTANEVCKTNLYAAHTGGGNTGSIGIALCGMFGFKDKHRIGNYPITKVQFESAMQLCAKVAQKYEIPISKTTVMTHYEFGLANPKTTSAGKIDIVFLPPYSWVAKEDVGNFIRTKIRWYLQNLNRR